MKRKLNIDNNGNICGFDLQRKDYQLVEVDNWEFGKFCKPKVIQENNKWQVIETATPEELQAFQKEKQKQEISEFNERKSADGQVYKKAFDLKVSILMRGKTETEQNNLDKQIRAKIISIVALINDGDWFTAKNYINNRSLPTIPEVIELFKEVRQDANDYVDDNYPKNNNN